MMSMKSLMVLAVSCLISACSCVDEKPAASNASVVEPAATSAALVAPPNITKESEQPNTGAATAQAAEKSVAETAHLPAQAPEGVSRCWLKGDMRTITTEQGKDGSCQVVYDSTDQNHVVASKSRELAECTRLHERLKKNLVASGFKCE